MQDVLTIGDAMITMNPKQRGPMRFTTEFERRIGGAELNVAVGCARLGLQTGMITRLGRDEFGRHILNTLRGEGIDMSGTALEEHYATPVNFKETLENGNGRTFYYRFPSPTEELTVQHIKEQLSKQPKVFYMTGVFASLRPENVEMLREAARFAREQGTLTAMDPNIRLKLWSREAAGEAIRSLLPYADIMLSGKDEADILFGGQSIEEHIASFQSYGIDRIIIKNGSEGAAGKHGSSKTVYQPAEKVEKAADTVGAGDGFNAGFLYGLLQGYPLEKALKIGSVAGAKVVQVAGDNEGLPLLEEVEAALGNEERVER
ncbi:sugar kinase [Marinococcus halophilus]|uniref:2-dehydro-3-deoxygluconokinase n=1 Tax=Marinococcus halophilus TaxID=1371 RepID=A0A510Y9U4_MARHA|nr:sugar kinase [Marinococcus halophilus]OZT78861.1 sugar kinase [Marinococcus halophilus]GEK60162.1 2-dehydro-3-deoxygluconokinase [Marinococcus halophilus]